MSKDKTHTRCPTCGAQGSRIQYGFPAGPPEPGVVLGGCLIGPDNPDFLCEGCRTSWRITTGGRVVILDPGSLRLVSEGIDD